MNTTSAPFFIVGSGRSGSTLLRVILASHSRLTIPPETWFMLPLLRRLPIDRPLNAEEVDCATRMITGHYRWPDMQLPAADFHRRVYELQRPLLRDIVEIVYQEHMRRDEKRRWGDKTPGYIEVLPQLARLFPGSRFIHLCRDGRDVAKSFQERGWYGSWLHDNTREWNESLDYRAGYWQSDLCDRIFDVKYENLVLDTEATVRCLCDFLGERFEPQLLEWGSRVDKLIPEREMRIHGKLKRQPASTDVNRWQREMTAREVFVTEAFIGKRLERAGYERKFKSAVWAPLLCFTRGYCIALSAAARFLHKLFGRVHTRNLRPPGAATGSGIRE